MDKIKSEIESLLFVASKPLTSAALAKMLEKEKNEIEKALQELAAECKERGIVLLEANGSWQFATNARNSAAVKNFLNAELREKLTDATVETLAIIAYRQPISRAEIEAIRGVNCQYSLRHLLIRGLIQKIPNPADARQNLYETTLEFLQHIGIASVAELEDFKSLAEKIKLPETPKESLAETNPEQANSENAE